MVRRRRGSCSAAGLVFGGGEWSLGFTEAVYEMTWEGGPAAGIAIGGQTWAGGRVWLLGGWGRHLRLVNRRSPRGICGGGALGGH